MPETWETEWSELDRPTRARLRRAAVWGREVSDPREAALVAAFAREKATESRALQLGLHALVTLGIAAVFVLSLIRGRELAPLYGALLVINLVVFGVLVTTRERLRLAAELNDGIASSGG